MRWVVLTQYFSPEIGAPQVRLGAMVRELVRLGHDVEVVTALPNYPTGRILEEYRGGFYRRDSWHGITVHRVWLYPSLGVGFGRMANYLSFVLTLPFGLMRATRPDFVFAESPPLFLGIHGVLMSRLWRARLIFNVADLWPDSVRELGILRDGLTLRLAARLERWIYRHAHFVNAVTEGIRSTLINQKAVPAEKVLFLPNGVDTELFAPREPNRELRRTLGLDGRKVLLYAGTVSVAQRLDVALDAMEILRRDHPDVVLVLMGDGSDKARLQREAGRRGLDDVVIFLEPGPPESVAQLYTLAHAGFASLRDLPLFDGARPSKILPPMAAGRPVIYSGAGEGARVIERAKAGIVVPPENAVRLAEAVRRLIEDPAYASQLGRNARQFAERECGWDKLIPPWVDALMERCAAKPKSTAATRTGR